MNQTNKRYTFWGGYGHGNAGDELTLAVAINDKKLIASRISVITPRISYSQALFPDENFTAFDPYSKYGDRNRTYKQKILRKVAQTFKQLTPRYNVNAQIDQNPLKEWVQSIAESDILYLVGGGYLTDLFDLHRFLLPIEVARKFGVAVATAPLGIGPFIDRESPKLFAQVLGGVALTVRDEDSAKICEQLSLNYEVRPDDGFRASEVIDGPKERSERTDVLGVNCFNQHGAPDSGKSKEWWREVLGIIVSEGIKVEGFCFHNNYDADFLPMVELFQSAGLSSQAVRPPFFGFREACLQLRKYRFIVSARFHAVVVANAWDISGCAVSSGEYYNSKMNAACKGGKCLSPIRQDKISSVSAARKIIEAYYNA